MHVVIRRRLVAIDHAVSGFSADNTIPVEICAEYLLSGIVELVLERGDFATCFLDQVLVVLGILGYGINGVIG